MALLQLWTQPPRDHSSYNLLFYHYADDIDAHLDEAFLALRLLGGNIAYGNQVGDLPDTYPPSTKAEIPPAGDSSELDDAPPKYDISVSDGEPRQ